MALIVFYALAALTVLSAMVTAFSRNIVYSAFALFGSFAGVAGIYILLGADFLFIIQVFIYIGGILVVTIFAVMLTQGVADVNVSNRAVGVIPGLAVMTLVGAVMLYAVTHTVWPQAPARRRCRRLTVSATRFWAPTCCPSRWPRSCCWPRWSGRS